MISIPGKYGATCDGFSRREFLRLGGAGLVGLSLTDILRIQAQQAPGTGPAPSQPKNGWGQAKSVIILYLQGGPSHIDIWDPKPDAPSNVRGDFKPIRSKVPGINLSEVMPKLAQQMDKATLIRSMSYTPVGLFNHTDELRVRGLDVVRAVETHGSWTLDPGVGAAVGTHRCSSVS